MPKSIHRNEYEHLLALLREVRVRVGMTQMTLAPKVGTTQSMVSLIERGGRRLDVIELRDWCRALGTTLPAFCAELERRIEGGNAGRRKPRSRREPNGSGD